MKILLCSSTYEGITHGPAKFANLVMQVNDLYPEHEVRTITRDVDKETPDSIYKFERTYPPIIGAFWEYWDNQLFLNNINTVLKTYKPDSMVFVDAILGYKTAKAFKGRIKTVGLINDDEYINNKLSAIKPTKEWLIKWKSRQLEKRAAKALDIVIGNSNFISKKIALEYHISQDKVRRLYKSIDISNFDFVAHGVIELDKPIKILFVKNDYQRGGLRELAESLSKLPKYTFEVIVCGPHDHQKHIIDDYFKEKKNITHHFRGKTSQAGVKQLLDECDIFSVPALREGLGVANIEALAKGIPVVSTNAGGIPEVLNGEECGWVAEAGNIDSLAKTFEECILSEDIKMKKSRAGRDRVEKMFGHKEMLQNLLEIISSS